MMEEPLLSAAVAAAGGRLQNDEGASDAPGGHPAARRGARNASRRRSSRVRHDKRGSFPGRPRNASWADAQTDISEEAHLSRQASRTSVLGNLMSPGAAPPGRAKPAQRQDTMSPREELWRRQVDMVNPSKAWLQREYNALPSLVSNFRLEVLDATTIKVIMAFFYVSVGLAFFTKIWSEQTLVIRNICGGHAGLHFGEWNSTTCRLPRDGRQAYAAGEAIPISHMPYGSIQCPDNAARPGTGACMKWEGELDGLALLHRFTFLSFIVEDAAPKQYLNTRLWLTGFAHRLDDGKPAGNPFLLPPAMNGGASGDDMMKAMNQSNVTQWPRYSTKFICKVGHGCDVTLFAEPMYQVNWPHHVQLLLLNADEVIPLLNDTTQGRQPHINIAFVYPDWPLGLIDLVFRYTAIVVALIIVAQTFWHLGCRNFLFMRPHFRLFGSIRSKPWLTEQRWMISAMMLLIVYLNPLKLPMMATEADQGRDITGPGWSMRDRIYVFVDRNLALYYVNFVRMFEIVILACCRGKESSPMVSCRWSHRQRAWIYWALAAWFVALLVQDFFRLYDDYHGYYHDEAGVITEDITSGDWLSAQSFFMGLLLLWCLGMLYFFFSASSKMLKLNYWATRSRQLSFRFFFFLYFWHIAYTLTQATYCWWKFNQGRALFEGLVCTDLSSGDTVGEVIANGVFVLVLGFAFSPVVYTKGQLPPDPFTQRTEWLNTRWPHSWVNYLNRSGNSTTYFFFWQSDRIRFRIAQEDEAGEDRGRSGLLGAAQKVGEKVQKSAKAARDRGMEAAKSAKLAAAKRAAAAATTAGQKAAAARARIQRLGGRVSALDLDGVGEDAAGDVDVPTPEPPGLRNGTPSQEPISPAGGRKAMRPTNVSFGGVQVSQMFSSDTSEVLPEAAQMYTQEKPKPLFCLELAVEMLCMSWEVYGEEPGSDHSLEATQGKMPIDCERHGYRLLEVIRGSANKPGAAGGGLYLCDSRHDGHLLSYRYVPVINCASGEDCPLSRVELLPAAERPRRKADLKRGMAYVCQEDECSVSPFMLCRHCVKRGHQPGVPRRNTVGGASAIGGAASLTHTMHSRMAGAMNNVWRAGQKVGNVIDTARHAVEDRITHITSQEEEIKSSDLQAIIAVGDPLGPGDRGRVVISFRGTNCFQNVKTDAQFFRDPFDEMLHNRHWSDLTSLRRVSGFGLPRCHRGFLKAYRMIEPEVIERLGPILKRYPQHEVLVTGHSLGGALACLMAYSLTVKFQDVVPIVYTYGCPKVGNRAFRRHYDDHVPHCFRVVNQNDIVSTIPLSFCGMLFQHVGREVCVDNKGNLIIEPTFIEEFVGPTKAARNKLGLLKLNRGSFMDHLMGRYARSLGRAAELLGVKDCNFRMAPEQRPAWLRYRRRWFLEGAKRGQCILCEKDCNLPGVCAISGQFHIPMPQENDGWSDSGRSEVSEVNPEEWRQRQQGLAALGVISQLSKGSSLLEDSGSFASCPSRSQPPSPCSNARSRSPWRAEPANWSRQPRGGPRSAGSGRRQQQQREERPSRNGRPGAVEGLRPSAAAPRGAPDRLPPRRSCPQCGKGGVLLWAAQCPQCSARLSPVPPPAPAHAADLQSPPRPAPGPGSCGRCGTRLMQWAVRCPRCEAAVADPAPPPRPTDELPLPAFIQFQVDSGDGGAAVSPPRAERAPPARLIPAGCVELRSQPLLRRPQQHPYATSGRPSAPAPPTQRAAGGAAAPLRTPSQPAVGGSTPRRVSVNSHFVLFAAAADSAAPPAAEGSPPSSPPDPAARLEFRDYTTV
eukprot:TRINITY_DN20434_c0_g1_i1.p1 TRINITY_DN20434_c0_g1~~TRINITY_DN20434_c0_g1_i1.p1  ORF type:complete len:1777 (+),score=357.84 TRINITY_DN20434_c0_g1_i1:82-5412(+)